MKNYWTFAILKLALLVFSLANSAQAADEPSISKDWTVCKADSDCVNIRPICDNKCGPWLSINSRYQSEYDDLKSLSKNKNLCWLPEEAADCLREHLPGKATCVTGLCSSVIPKSSLKKY